MTMGYRHDGSGTGGGPLPDVTRGWLWGLFAFGLPIGLVGGLAIVGRVQILGIVLMLMGSCIAGIGMGLSIARKSVRKRQG